MLGAKVKGRGRGRGEGGGRRKKDCQIRKLTGGLGRAVSSLLQAAIAPPKPLDNTMGQLCSWRNHGGRAPILLPHTCTFVIVGNKG